MRWQRFRSRGCCSNGAKFVDQAPGSSGRPVWQVKIPEYGSWNRRHRSGGWLGEKSRDGGWTSTECGLVTDRGSEWSDFRIASRDTSRWAFFSVFVSPPPLDPDPDYLQRSVLRILTRRNGELRQYRFFLFDKTWNSLRHFLNSK